MQAHWTEEQLIQNIPEHYRSIFHKVKNEYLIENEKILFCAYGMHSHWSKSESRWSVSCLPGVILLSSKRYFRTGISHKNVWLMNQPIYYRHEGRAWLSIVDGKPFGQWEWQFPLKKVPPKHEIFVLEVPLESLPELRGHETYTIDYKGEEFDIIEIALEDAWLTFLKSDGEIIYRLLQKAKLNNGRIQFETSSQPQNSVEVTNFIDELTKLANLLEKNLITEQEFEAAKKKLF